MKWKLLSLRTIWAHTRDTFLRFPEPLLFAITAAVLSLVVVEKKLEDDNLVYPLIAVLSLGISLGFALATYCEFSGLRPVKRRALFCGAFVALAALFGSYFLQTPSAFIYRYLELFLAAHLLVAFLPYLRRGEPGFWQYNQRLFVRTVFSAFFSQVLFYGILVALFSMDYLLGIEVGSKTFSRLAIFMSFVFNTWFFLAGVPKPLPSEDEPETFPRGLSVFSKYLLIPLVTVYLLILYAYMAKIGIEWRWPKGNVGYLVSAFSLLGILALLLVHPIQHITENRWIKIYTRGFYFALFPLVGLLLVGTLKRISEYGVTEKRYLLLALAIWFASMATYFTLGKKRDIRVIPISLCLLILLTIFGPWSAYSVAYRSQRARLETLLKAEGVLVDGKAKPMLPERKKEIPWKTTNEISSMVDYLVSMHGGRGIEAWFSPETQASVKSFRSDRDFTLWRSETANVARSMMHELGLDYRGGGSSTEHFNLTEERGKDKEIAGPDIAGFQTFAGFRLYPNSHDMQKVHFSWKGKPFSVSLDGKTGSLRVEGADQGSVPLRDLVRALKSTKPSQFQPGVLSVEFKGGRHVFRAYFQSLSGNLDEDGNIQISYVEGNLFLRPLGP